MKNCLECEGSFTPHKSHKAQRWCSPRCAQRARRAREKLTRETRNCVRCSESFPATHALRLYCTKECRLEHNKERTPARWKHIANRYGLTRADFEAMLLAQGNRCAICATTLDASGPSASAPNVDHDHKTGQVRAILCKPCNIALGHLRDDPNVVRAALDYLIRWEAADSTSVA